MMMIVVFGSEDEDKDVGGCRGLLDEVKITRN